MCKDCYKSCRQSRRKGKNGSAMPTVSSISSQGSESFEVTSQISVVSLCNAPEMSSDPDQLPVGPEEVFASLSSAGQVTPIKLGHHIFTSGEWKRAKLLDHPTMDLSLSVRKGDYKGFSSQQSHHQGQTRHMCTIMSLVTRRFFESWI